MDAKAGLKLLASIALWSKFDHLKVCDDQREILVEIALKNGEREGSILL